MSGFERLKGIIAAPFTPMDANGEVNPVPVACRYILWKL